MSTQTEISNYYISQIAHESDMARMERTVKRFATLCIIELVIILIFGAIIGYMFYYESQFEDVVAAETVTQDSGNGGNNTFTGDFIGGDYYGETDSNTND